ncbi:DNA repair protein RAD16 [Verticillium dahliae VDG1]|nr:DNA repair protein RAD16 [Verticillium dahliae VDG1]
MDTKDLTKKATEYASQNIDLYALIALDPATTDAKQIHRAELEREKARMGEELRRRRAEEDERFRREAEEKRNREEDEGDERIQELQRRLEETRRRKAEKKARKRGELPPETESKDAPKTNGGEGKAPKWEDLKARMIAVQKKRDAAKLAAAQETAAGTAEEDDTTA